MWCRVQVLTSSPLMLPTPLVRHLDDRVYEPAEDSFLLLDCLEERLPQLQQRRFPVVCEIGTGSGIVTTFLKANVFPHGVFLATDVNPTACATALATAAQNDVRGVDALQMSLTSGIRRHAVDVLVFNPPYVPAEDVPAIPQTDADSSWLDLALLGGSDGMVVTWEVLDRLDEILAADGVAYVLFCARNRPAEVAAEMERRGWVVRRVMERKAGWEVLSVLEISH